MQTAPRTPETFTVMYRTGGTLRCRWVRCAAVATRAEAVPMVETIERMGYKALVFRTAYLDAVGGPEGWDA